MGLLTHQRPVTLIQIDDIKEASNLWIGLDDEGALVVRLRNKDMPYFIDKPIIRSYKYQTVYNDTE